MRTECIEAVGRAIGRSLNAAEAKGIEDRLAKHMRQNAAQDPTAALGMTPEQRLGEAAKTAAEELIAEAAKKKQRVALTILAHDRVQRHIAQFPNQFDGIDRMLAFHADGKANTLSVESRATAIERDALRQMLDTLEATNPKFFGLLESTEGVNNLVRELHGQKSGDADAAAGAKTFHEIAETLRVRFNSGGGDVGQLEDWGMPHHHSQTRVAKAGREAWVNESLPMLNRSKYVNADGSRMDEGQLRDFLGNAWESIATGGANKLDPGRPGGNGMRANRGNETRQIHFKDGDAYIAYQAKFGERSMYEVLTGHISSVAKDIALVETFGPNPDLAFKLFSDKAMKEQSLTNPTDIGQAQKRALKSEDLYNMVAGKTLPVASEWLANTFDTLRSWMVASRLGSAVITSMSDEATIRLSARANNLPQMRLFANQLATLNPANQVEKRMALRAGLAMNTLLSSLNRFGNDSLTSTAAGKIAGATMRASGLNALTEARKRAYGVTFMGAVGGITKDHASLADIDAADHRILMSKGITDADFAVWKRANLDDWGGGNDTMLTPDAIYRIPDDQLADLGNPRQLKEQAATRLLGLVLEETNVAIIEPGAKERALMMSGLQRGTWKGELTRSFFLFKSFPIAMLTRHWSRGMSMPTGTGRAAYIATLVASTTVMGMVSMQINEMLGGKDPRNMNPLDGGARNWMAAMLKGGSLGIYGDFLFSESSQYGRSPLASALGPVASFAEEVLSLTQGNIMEMMQGKDTDVGAETVKFVKSNTPGANLWYAKASLDHLIFHRLQEYFSPGYLRKMRKRAEKEFGQEYYWEPGETLPDRAPDLEAATGDN